MKPVKSLENYFMESDAETGRLVEKTDIASTVKQLKSVGVKEGMAVLDVGCGPGVVTGEIAKIIFPGEVVGLDQNADRLEHARKEFRKSRISNISFKHATCYKTELPDESFDLVWSRFLFEYLKKPLEALSEMKRVCRYGGKVVVADLDLNCLLHYPLDRGTEEKLNQVIKVVSEKTGFDPYVGRKLYTFFKKCGFENIKVHAGYHHLLQGKLSDLELRNWEQKLNMAKPFWNTVFSSIEEYEAFVHKMIQILKDENRFTYSPLFIVEGTKSE